MGHGTFSNRAQCYFLNSTCDMGTPPPPPTRHQGPYPPPLGPTWRKQEVKLAETGLTPAGRQRSTCNTSGLVFIDVLPNTHKTHTRHTQDTHKTVVCRDYHRDSLVSMGLLTAWELMTTPPLYRVSASGPASGPVVLPGGGGGTQG